MNAALAEIDLGTWWVQYTIALLRTFGVFAFVPIFSAEVVPLRVRGGMAAVLAFAFMPFVAWPGTEALGVAGFALVATRELSVGFVLGLSARMIVAGIEGAAGLIAGQAGFAMASMVDPLSGDQGLAPSLFQNLIGLTLLLAADLHHVFIRAIVGSYEVLPPAAALVSFGGLDVIAGAMGARLFTLAVELAAPALVVSVCVDVVIALVGRAMPQVPILLIGYPFKLVAGLGAMFVLATTTGATLGWIGRTLASDGARVIAALAGR